MLHKLLLGWGEKDINVRGEDFKNDVSLLYARRAKLNNFVKDFLKKAMPPAITSIYLFLLSFHWKILGPLSKHPNVLKDPSRIFFSKKCSGCSLLPCLQPEVPVSGRTLSIAGDRLHLKCYQLLQTFLGLESQRILTAFFLI